MKAIDRFKLLGGPYRPPKVKRGGKLFCEIRGTVTVGGFRNGPVPWPYSKQRGCPPILCGDMIKAIKFESRLAVCHHFLISREIVRAWRRALNAPVFTEGTRRLHGAIANNRTDDRIVRAREASKTPAALAKASASLKGRIQSAKTITAVRKAAKRPRSKAWKIKMAEYWRRRGHPPGHPELRFWTPDEDALLGTDTDSAIARRLGRTLKAVNQRRRKIGTARFKRVGLLPRVSSKSERHSK
jgi:hypothetical protein